jgi:hypothetical protein
MKSFKAKENWALVWVPIMIRLIKDLEVDSAFTLTRLGSELGALGMVRKPAFALIEIKDKITKLIIELIECINFIFFIFNF